VPPNFFLQLKQARPAWPGHCQETPKSLSQSMRCYLYISIDISTGDLPREGNNAKRLLSPTSD
jgi:hypothetical protein